jgi:ribosomal protein L11 methyltransferase
MNDYTEVDLQIEPLLPGREILIYELGEIGAESFEEQSGGLLAWFPFGVFNEDELKKLIAGYSNQFTVNYSSRSIKQENWNAEWESGFQPIIVNEQCRIRAPFHEEDTNYEHEILIRPQMSFGTGHHATTWLMARRLFALDLTKRSVLDMGCGTGVLAFLAKMLGAGDVTAIDIDEWSYLNTIENMELNRMQGILVEKGDSSLLAGRSFQVILANINRNVLLADLPVFTKALEAGGKLLLSGFFTSDVPVLREAAEKTGLVFEEMEEKDTWVVLQFKKD